MRRSAESKSQDAQVGDAYRDRRQHPRVDSPGISVNLFFEGHECEAEVENLSLSGARVACTSPLLRVGGRVLVATCLPGAGEITLQATIVYVDRLEDGCKAGLRFLSLDHTNIRALYSYLYGAGQVTRELW